MIRSAWRTWRFIANHPLGQRSQGRSLGRWLRWQVASRLGWAPIATPFANGTQLLVDPGMTGATGNVYVGLHEFADMALVLHFLRPEDLFIDIGANIGSYTVLAAGAIGARAIACEPVPTTFTNLERNLRWNRLEDRVTAHRTAVGSAAGEILFTADNDTTNQVARSDYRGATVRVPVQSADDLLATVGAAVQMWKVDVEGYEHEVLAGAEQTLANSRLKAVLLEAGDAEIAAIMRRHSFQAAGYDPFTRTLQLAGPRGNNYLWVRDFDFVAERVRTAPEFSVLEFRV